MLGFFLPLTLMNLSSCLCNLGSCTKENEHNLILPRVKHISGGESIGTSKPGARCLSDTPRRKVELLWSLESNRSFSVLGTTQWSGLRDGFVSGPALFPWAGTPSVRQGAEQIKVLTCLMVLEKTYGRQGSVRNISEEKQVLLIPTNFLYWCHMIIEHNVIFWILIWLDLNLSSPKLINTFVATEQL